MMLTATATRTIRFGVLVLALSAIVGACELLALQVPGSALYIGVLPGPIGALREMAMTLGLLLLAAGALMPWAYGDDDKRARVIAGMLALGALLALAAQGYGASRGMPGVQMQDMRPDARAVFVLRHLGLATFAVAALDLGVRLLQRPAV
jgi:hypothetical protein